MKVLLKFEIDTDVDAAWHALRTPATLAEIYAPLITMEQLGDDGDEMDATTMPPSLAVQLRLFGVIPIGRQLITVTTSARDFQGETVRVFRDSGIPLTGPLASLDVWDHQMALSPVPGDPSRTLWRDRLVVGGPAALLLWPTLWAMWQWRQRRIRSLARTWAHD